MPKKDKQMPPSTENSVTTPAPVEAPVATVTPIKTPPMPPTPPTAPAVSVPSPGEKMADIDKLQLDLAKSRKDTALAQAKEALAKNETAELNYKYVILQLYMKYGLTQADAISENGDIVRGGALAHMRQQGK